MMIKFLNAKLTGADETGRLHWMFVWRALSIDCYSWPSRRYKFWWFPSVGVLGDLRLGRLEFQARWTPWRRQS